MVVTHGLGLRGDVGRRRPRSAAAATRRSPATLPAEAAGFAPPSPARWSSDSGAAAPAAPDFSVDLTASQAQAFVEFVSLLADVEASGTSMVHLAQAAVDQAGAQLKAAEAP